jgi:outer membrane protein TolC
MTHPYFRPALVCAACALLLAACGTAPVYQKPAVATPSAFKEAGLWKVARSGTGAAAAQVPDTWWTLFNDPVLNELQAGVAIGNENLKGSAAQVQVARAALASTRASGSPVLGIGSGITYGANGAGSTPTTSNSIAANASWELDLWGRVATAASGAEARLQASGADLDAARLSVQALLTQTTSLCAAAKRRPICWSARWWRFSAHLNSPPTATPPVSSLPPMWPRPPPSCGPPRCN